MNQESKNLWLAVIFAVVAGGLLYSHIQERNKEVSERFGQKAAVVVAKKVIGEMEPINESHIELKEMPVDFISPGAITDPNDAIGMVALSPFKEGESLIRNKITKPSPLTGLSLQVAPGKRALTVPIDDMRGVAKLVKPGDMVDLIAAVSVGKGKDKNTEVRTIMQKVPILATGVKIANELPVLYEKNKRGNEVIIRSLTRDTSYTSVTIEVSPLEAQKIIFILNQNPKNLTMTLRHPTDTGPVYSTSTTAESILGKRRRPASPSNKTKAGAR